MFQYIKGILTETSPLKVTVDVHGLGYLLFIPLNNFSKLPALNSPITLYVSTVIREDSYKNYGFLSLQQRDLFECLIEVSGIGPRTALALLGHMEIADLQLAISQANAQLISKIPGIGKKTSERLIVEMRDKITKFSDKNSPSQPLSAKGEEQGVVSDAISALMNLGYNQPQAQKAISSALSHMKGEPHLAQLITAALRRI